VNPDEVHRAGERGNAIGHPQLNGAASPLGLLQHGWMVDLIVAQQPVGDELRDAPIPFGAWACHVLSFRGSSGWGIRLFGRWFGVLRRATAPQHAER
jgi:hypothetical protein